jgi:hypothetical protein
MQAVVRLLAAAILVHAGRRVAALDGAFRRVAARAFKKQLQAIATTETTDRTSNSSHVCKQSNNGKTMFLLSHFEQESSG